MEDGNMKTIKLFIVLLALPMFIGCSSDDGPKASQPPTGPKETCDKTNTCHVTVRTTKNYVFQATFDVDDNITYRRGARKIQACDHTSIPLYYQEFHKRGLLGVYEINQSQKCSNLSSEITAYLKTSPAGRTQLQLIGNRKIDEVLQILRLLALPPEDRLTATIDDLSPQFNFFVMPNAKVKKLNKETSDHAYELTDSSVRAKGFRFFLDGSLTNNTHSLILTVKYEDIEVFQQELVR